MVCDYCEESDEYVELILKPQFFLSNDKSHPLVQAFRGQDLICLNCLMFEMGELKNI